MKIGFVSYSPRYPVADQRKALAEWGAGKVYGGDVQDMIRAIRPAHKDVIGVYGLHRLAPSWSKLTTVLADIERKGATVYDLELDLAGGTASVSNAKRVYAGERIFSSGDDAETRGRRGGRQSSLSRTIKLTGNHKNMWRDKKYRTNEDAALAISNALGKPVSVPTIRRRFGASGRPGGWPGMNK